MVGVGIWLEWFKWNKSKDNFVFVVEDVEQLTTDVLNQVYKSSECGLQLHHTALFDLRLI